MKGFKPEKVDLASKIAEIIDYHEIQIAKEIEKMKEEIDECLKKEKK